MKNLFKILGIIAVAAVIVVSMSSCAMLSSIGGAGNPHGLFTGSFAADKLIEGTTEIASYMVIIGLIDSGFDKYAATVKAAEASGKRVYSVTKWYYVLTITRAYTR